MVCVLLLRLFCALCVVCGGLAERRFLLHDAPGRWTCAWGQLAYFGLLHKPGGTAPFK